MKFGLLQEDREKEEAAVMLCRTLFFRIVLLPFEPDHRTNGQGEKGKIDDTGIKALRGLFSQLLGRTGTDGTLGKEADTYHEGEEQ